MKSLKKASLALILMMSGTAGANAAFLPKAPGLELDAIAQWFYELSESDDQPAEDSKVRQALDRFDGKETLTAEERLLLREAYHYCWAAKNGPVGPKKKPVPQVSEATAIQWFFERSSDLDRPAPHSEVGKIISKFDSGQDLTHEESAKLIRAYWTFQSETGLTPVQRECKRAEERSVEAAARLRMREQCRKVLNQK